jgi:hypothetical protein
LAPAASIFRIRSKVISASLKYCAFKDQGILPTRLYLPFSDFLELVRVLNKNLYTKLHTLLLQIDIQARNLGIRYAFFHC